MPDLTGIACVSARRGHRSGVYHHEKIATTTAARQCRSDESIFSSFGISINNANSLEISGFLQ